MKTHSSIRSGFALGTVMVLALIMLAAVGSLLGFAINESRSAFRNQLATAAFHRAEEGIELAIDALARDVHTKATSGWSAVSGSRFKKTISIGNTALVVFIDVIDANTFAVRSRATVTRSNSLSASRAIFTRFVSTAGTTAKKGAGPAIYGIQLKLSGDANSDDKVNHYAQFKSRYGKPVWNPRKFYPNNETYKSLWTKDEDNNAITNCFEGFRIESPATNAADVNIDNSYIYGHVATKAPGITYAYESTAADKPCAWIGEDLAPSTNTNSWTAEQRPYSGWTELPDRVVYGTHPTYATADADKATTIDGKCIEQGLPALDTSWLVTPKQPTVKTVGTGDSASVVIDDVGSSSLASGAPTLVERNSQYEDKFTPQSQTITWPRDNTEDPVIIRVQDFEANNTDKLVINSPVTLLVTGSNLKLNSDSITFGPKGSLTVFYNGSHIEMDKVKTLTYTPLRDANGKLLSNQSTALAASTDNYNPDKLVLNCSASSGDIVIHANENNPLITAKIIAPSMTIELHAASNRSTFIGQLIGNIVTSTNNFDFFYDIDNGGGGGGGGTTKTWSIGLWRQIQPQTVSDTMPAAT